MPKRLEARQIEVNPHAGPVVENVVEQLKEHLSGDSFIQFVHGNLETGIEVTAGFPYPHDMGEAVKDGLIEGDYEGVPEDGEFYIKSLNLDADVPEMSRVTIEVPTND